MKVIYKNWFIHNMIGHPFMQIFNMLGFKGLALTIHDSTLPYQLNNNEG